MTQKVCTPKWYSTRIACGGFLKTANTPSFTNKTAHLAIHSVLFGWIRLIAQGCTCANCPSVSTERWFGAHSARRFDKPPIHPAPQRKTALISADFHGGEGWIRTTEVTDNRFTVCSLWPLGNLSVWSW